MDSVVSDRTLLGKAARKFGASADDMAPLTGGHFAAVYEWSRGGSQYVLKVAPTGQGYDLLAVRSIQSYLAWLALRGVPVMRPLASSGGNLVETVEHDGATYLVTAAPMVHGVRAEVLPGRVWSAPRVRQLGQILGRLHRASESYVPSGAASTRPAWDEASNCFNPLDGLAGLDEQLLGIRRSLMDDLARLPRAGGCWGLCHLDLHFANFIVSDDAGSITLVDFDDCGHGWFAMDIAMLLFDAKVVYGGEIGENLRERFLDPLLAGYRIEKPLSEFWVAQLPAFLKLLEIGVYSMLVRDYGSETSPDSWVGKFMQGRERRIREGIPYLA